jgi:hypothetical protein
MFWHSGDSGTFVNNLLRGDTEATSEWLRNLHKQASEFGYTTIDTYAFELKSAIEKAINSRIDPGIGGEVAVLVLERHRQARWFSKTPTCKAEN